MVNCSKCGKREASFLCSRCHAAYYCTETCQHEHWVKPQNSHKNICRECRDEGGKFFDGLQKVSILELANGKGGQIARSQGYAVFTAHALALRVSREHFVAALKVAPGELNEKWAKSLSIDEKIELRIEAPSSDPHLTSPMSAKKRKLSDTPEGQPVGRRAIDATPIRGEVLFGEMQKRIRIPKKQYLEDGPDESKPKPKRKARYDDVSVSELDSKISKSKSNSGEDDDEELVYEDLNKEDLTTSDHGNYWDKVGHVFEDTEDKIQFMILSICVSNDKKLGVFYKYRDLSDGEGGDDEYTPCAELLQADWVRWLE
jgi:hypothetical protein